jgi:hypothetical protein
MSDSFDEDAFDAAVRPILDVLSHDQIEKVADWIAGDHSGVAVLDEVTLPANRQAISRVLGATNLGSAEDREAAAKRLRLLNKDVPGASRSAAGADG